MNVITYHHNFAKMASQKLFDRDFTWCNMKYFIRVPAVPGDADGRAVVEDVLPLLIMFRDQMKQFGAYWCVLSLWGTVSRY